MAAPAPESTSGGLRGTSAPPAFLRMGKMRKSRLESFFNSGVFRWVFVSSLLSLGGCAGKSVDTDPRLENPVLYPAPPEQPRIQYLASISGPEDLKGGGGQSSSFFDRLVGEGEDAAETAIERPYGITSVPGMIFVCDIEGDRIVMLDLSREIYETLETPALRRPADCAADPADGRIYVTDVVENKVSVFSPDGALVGQLATEDEARPVSVHVGDRNVWVGDMEAHKIYAYDKVTLTQTAVLPDLPPDSVGGIGTPSGLAVFGDTIFVADEVNFVVSMYSVSGEVLGHFGGLGDNPGQFGRPKSVSVGPDGVIYVVDARHQNVQMFNLAGEVLMWFGGGYEGPGDMYLPASVKVDVHNMQYFEDRVLEGYELQYLVLVANQYGPDKLNVYGRIEPIGGSDVPQ